MFYCGIGDTLGAIIFSEIGDINRFDVPNKLVAFARLDVKVSQSGEFPGMKQHISKRGSPYLRRAIWLAANRAAFRDPILSDYYQSLKARSKHHLTAIGAVARKMCNIIFTILRENRPYEAAPPEKGKNSACVRKATSVDLPEVTALFKKAIKSMNDNEIFQWDGIYPDAQTLKADIDNGFMYLYMIDGKIASVFVLNHDCDIEYAEGSWKYDDSSFAVVHRLCVDPAFQHQGIGTRTMIAAESIIKYMNIDSVRLDAFSQNPAALRLYEKLGYAKVGAITLRKGLFYLFEKML